MFESLLLRIGIWKIYTYQKWARAQPFLQYCTRVQQRLGSAFASMKRMAKDPPGLSGSVGCASDWWSGGWRSIPTGSGSFFRRDWPWNIFYGHSLPSADSRGANVSECRTKSLSDKIPSAHFCIGGRNPLHVILQGGHNPLWNFLQDGHNPHRDFYKVDKIPSIRWTKSPLDKIPLAHYCKGWYSNGRWDCVHRSYTLFPEDWRLIENKFKTFIFVYNLYIFFFESCFIRNHFKTGRF